MAEQDPLAQLVRDYSKAIEQVSLIGDVIHRRINAIQRIIASVEGSPNKNIAVAGGFIVPSQAYGVIDDEVLSLDSVSIADFHAALFELAKAKAEKARIETCLRNTGLANLIKD